MRDYLLLHRFVLLVASVLIPTAHAQEDVSQWNVDERTGLRMNFREVVDGEEVEARLGFVTLRGVRHVVEKSHDLVIWTTVKDVYGFGQSVEVSVARRGAGGGVVPGDPSGGDDPVFEPGWYVGVRLSNIAPEAGGGVLRLGNRWMTGR